VKVPIRLLIALVSAAIVGALIDYLVGFLLPKQLRIKHVAAVLVAMLVFAALAVVAGQQSVQTKEDISLPTPSVVISHGENVTLTEGEVAIVSVEGKDLSAAVVRTETGLFSFDYVGTDANMILSTADVTTHTTVTPGGCIYVAPFAVHIIGIEVEGPQKVTFFVTKMEDDFTADMCTQ